MSSKTSRSATASPEGAAAGAVGARNQFRHVGHHKKGGKRRKITIPQLFETNPTTVAVVPAAAPAASVGRHPRFLMHKEIMRCVFPIVKHLCDVSEDGTYSLPIPFDKLMLLVGQDAEDKDGNFVGKSIAWMKARKALFWTASKPSGSSFDVSYYHEGMMHHITVHANFCVGGALPEFEPPCGDTVQAACSPAWNALVSFKEVQDTFTPLGYFRMQHGTDAEDDAIVEFLRLFKDVYAAEEYLHIFNASTRHLGFSAGTSPDGLLLWYKGGTLYKVTSLEVKCPGTCTNAKCKKERKLRAQRDGASLDDEGYFCRNKAHFKPHSCIKTYYVVQMMLEMLGANTLLNVYVSMGYDAKGNPKIKSFIMKFHRGALMSGVVYMRSLAQLKDLVKTELESRDAAALHQDPEYQRVSARAHQNFETMIRFSEHACMGAHGYTGYSKLWRGLTPWQQDSVRNAKPLDPKEHKEQAPQDKQRVHNDLANAWLDSTPRHEPVDFENPDTTTMLPLTQEQFETAYLGYCKKDAERWVAQHPDDPDADNHQVIGRSDYLALCTPQGVLSDEFYFCPGDEDDCMRVYGDPTNSTWSLSPIVDDAVIEARNHDGEYRVHLRRTGYNKFRNPLEQAESDSEKEETPDLSDLLDCDDEYYTSDDEDEPEQVTSLQDYATFALLLKLESEEGLSVQEWLVERTETERHSVLNKIAQATGWNRIVPLPNVQELQARSGEDVISSPHLSTYDGDFDRIFLPPLTAWKRCWTFTRYAFQRKMPWDTQRHFAAPPRIGAYDDDGNIFMNFLGELDDKLPKDIFSVPKGAKVKVVVSDVWQSTCSFHTLLLHKKHWKGHLVS